MMNVELALFGIQVSILLLEANVRQCWLVGWLVGYFTTSNLKYAKINFKSLISLCHLTQAIWRFARHQITKLEP